MTIDGEQSVVVGEVAVIFQGLSVGSHEVSVIVVDASGVPYDNEGASMVLTFYFGYRGDLNQDTLFNVMDVVQLVQTIINEWLLSDFESALCDVNDDGGRNVLDVVNLIDHCLGFDW